MGCYTWNWMHIRVHNENNACSELLALMKKVRDRVGENPECEPNERSYNIVRDGKKFNLANECECNAYKNNENAAWKHRQYLWVITSNKSITKAIRWACIA